MIAVILRFSFDDGPNKMVHRFVCRNGRDVGLARRSGTRRRVRLSDRESSSVHAIIPLYSIRGSEVQPRAARFARKKRTKTRRIASFLRQVEIAVAR